WCCRYHARCYGKDTCSKFAVCNVVFNRFNDSFQSNVHIFFVDCHIETFTASSSENQSRRIWKCIAASRRLNLDTLRRCADVGLIQKQHASFVTHFIQEHTDFTSQHSQSLGSFHHPLIPVLSLSIHFLL